MEQALGILEINGWTSAMIALDSATKATQVRVLQVEWNDMLGAVIKLAGPVASIQSALEAGIKAAHAFNAKTSSTVIARPDVQSLKAILSPPEYNVLIEQPVVKMVDLNNNLTLDDSTNSSTTPITGTKTMSNGNSKALGFIETQGFTAVFEAIDTACKAASVQVLGKEKLGGGYITVVVSGDVAAVQAAIDAAKGRVEGLGKLIAAHVIARPSESVMALLPK